MNKMRRRAAAVLAVVMMLSMSGGTTVRASSAYSNAYNRADHMEMKEGEDAGDPDDQIWTETDSISEVETKVFGEDSSEATDVSENIEESSSESMDETESTEEEFSESEDGAEEKTEPTSGSETGTESASEEIAEEESFSAIPVEELTEERILQYIDGCLDADAVEDAVLVSASMMDTEQAEDVERIPTEASERVQVTPVNHTISIQYTIVDGAELGGASTITDMWENHWEAYLATYDIFAQMYAVDGNEDCFVAFINANLMNGQGTAVAMDLTDGDGVQPVIYDSKISYDQSTGLVYMPRSLFYDSSGNELPAGTENLQLQLMVAIDLDHLENNIRITTENYREDVQIAAEHQTIDGRSLNVETTIPLVTPSTASYVDLSKVYLYLNDSISYQIFEEGKYFFDRATGELTIPVSPITLYSVRVVIDDDSWFEKLKNAFTTTVYAATETAASVSAMQAVPNVTLSFSDDLKVGDYVDLTTTQKYASKSGNTYYSNFSQNQKKGLLNSALYLYYPIDDTLNAAYINLIDKNQGNLSSLLKSKVIGRYTTESYRWLYENQFYFISSTPQGTLKSKGGASLNVDELHTRLPWIAMHCTHQSSSLGKHSNTSSEYTDICRYRILDIDTVHKTLVIGMLVPKQQTQSGAAIFKFKYKIPTGSLRAAKKGSASGKILAGAEYQVYKDRECTTPLKDVNGKSILTTLEETPFSNTLIYPVGTRIYVKEIKAPEGTMLDPMVYESTIESDVTNWANGAKRIGGFFVDTEYGRIRMTKIDEDTGERLEGASYAAYKEFECKTAQTDVNDQMIQWINIEENGTAVDCARGMQLWICEEQAPDGYEISTDRYCVDLDAETYRIRRYDEKHVILSDTGSLTYEKDSDGTYLVEFAAADRKETVDTVPFTMQLIKKDAESDETTDHMEGAIFALEYWSVATREAKGLDDNAIRVSDGNEELGDPDMIWYYRTDDGGRITITDRDRLMTEYTFVDGSTIISAELPADEEGNVAFSTGSYRIREICPPSNYSMEGRMMRIDESGDITGQAVDVAKGLRVDLLTKPKGDEPAVWCSGIAVDETLLTVQAEDYVYRNEVQVVKTGSNHQPLEGVVFLLERSDGSASIEGITDREGCAQWTDLLPGEYILTEVQTTDGYELLTESIAITLPLKMTEQEVKEQNVDIREAFYDEVTGTYCFTKLTYEITDSASLDLPVTGSNDWQLLWIAVPGLLLLAGGLYLELRHR